MKNLMAKIKTLDYKQFALEHGEKIGLGVIGLVALVCLGMTHWASDYSGTPELMIKTADDVAAKLKANRWPDSAKQAFLPVVDAESQLNRVVSSIDPKKFEWTVEMSPKLYPRQLPAEEPIWTTVTELYAFTGKMPMAIPAPLPPLDAADDDSEAKKPEVKKPEAKKPAKGSKKGNKKNDADDLLMGSMGSMMSSAGMAGFGGPSSEISRGERFNVVLGIVNVQQQYKQLRSALHLDFPHQAKAFLEYVDFKVQRQRAVPGPDPWTGPWKDVATDTSIDILQEASDFDPEIIPLSYSNQVFTSPLPHRLDIDWPPPLVVHAKIPTLSEEEQDRQDLDNRAIAEANKAAGEEDAAGGRRGFARAQKDANRMREAAMSREGGVEAVSKARSSLGGGGMGAMPGSSAMAGMAGGRGGMMPGMGGDGGMLGGSRGGSGMLGMAGAGRGGMLGMAGGSKGGSGMLGMAGGSKAGGMPAGMSGAAGSFMMGGNAGLAGADGGADLLMFRYFDFDVEPGECYRYRVRLVVENPNYENAFVSASSVAEGEFRETDWSSPSTAVAVEKDIDYALVKVKGTGAELNVVQFDSKVGTLISDTFAVKYGAYVAATLMKSLRLELAPPDLKEDKVTFSSKDVLLDSAPAPKLSASAEADLKLTTKQRNNLLKNGDLELAVTLNRFGEIVDLDAGSKQDLQRALDKVKEERDPYKDINEAHKKAKKDAKEAEEEAKKSKRRGGRGKRGGQNPLKSGPSTPGAAGFGGAGGMPGMMPQPGGKTGKAGGQGH
jgi:hypothetical protein